MRKTISIFLSLMVVLGLFSGCSAEGTEDETSSESSAPETVKSQSLDVVIHDRGNDEEYWQAVIDAFEAANPGVEVEAYIGKDAGYVLRDRILSGDSPDFVVLPSDEETGVTAALIKDRAMQPITSLEQVASSLLIDGAFDNIYCMPYDDGETYLAPVFFEVEGLIYNKTLMDGNGWTVPSTWDEFIALGDLAKAKKISLFAYAGQEAESLTGMFASGIASSVGMEEEEKLFRYEEGAWDCVPVRTFLGYIDKLSYLVASGSSTKTEKEALDAFLAGNVLFINGDSALLAELFGEEKSEESGESGSAATTESVVAGPTFETGITGYPTFSAGDKKVTAITFTEMYIPIEAENVDLAEKFLIFQYSDTAASLCAEKLGEVTPVRKAADFAAASGITGSRLQAYSILGDQVCAGDFAIRSGANETLADEFAALLVSAFKGETDADTFISEMNGYVKEMQ